GLQPSRNCPGRRQDRHDDGIPRVDRDRLARERQGDDQTGAVDLCRDGGSSNSAFSSENDNWAVGTGVSVLFYLHTCDHLKTYFSPRITYNRNTQKSPSSGVTTATVKSTA